MEKKVNLRVEHVKHSKCRQEFLARVKKNSELCRQAKENGGMILFFFFAAFINLILNLNVEVIPSLRRIQALPKAAHTVSSVDNKPITIIPLEFSTKI